MLKNRYFLPALSVGVACFFAITAKAQTTGKQRLHGHLPEAVARFHLQPTGRLSATQHLNLAIGLPLRNEATLDSLLQQIYDPASPNFRQYLTPEQFTERFGPTEQDYQAVIDFAKANGLTVTGRHPNRVVLDVSAAAADIERVFHVTLHTYRHPSDARDFYAPDVEPSVDLTVPILQISGLNNYSLPHPSLKVEAIIPTIGMTPNSGSGPGNAYMGNDFRAAYAPGATLTGSGQSVALVQYDGYNSNDIAAYISMAGLTNYPISLTNVPVNGGVSVPGSGNPEVCLDIEMVIAMAPGVSKIIVYEAPNGSTAWPTMLSRIANDNLAKQISCSWSGGGPDAVSEGIFKQMASQGQSFFNATGDKDAFTGSIPFPSDSTNITEVGGTVLTTTGAGGSYVSETVWNDGTPNPNGGDWGSSGGISPTYNIPIWQQGISMTANQGSTTMRNLPDVALTATNIFIFADSGQQEKAEGTSCAAPLWAGFTALVNEQAANANRPSVGFINPAIYAFGKGTNYTTGFHDIVVGDNTWSGSPAQFHAASGYDLCTGWGTPTGTNLINALAGLAGTSIIQNGGFETGNFNGWTLAGNGIIGYTVYNAVVSAVGPVSGGTNFIHSGTYGAFLGDTQLATLSQTVYTFPGQDYLLSFWLANPVSGSVQQFLVNWNTNSAATNQIYQLYNPPVLPWTNITLVVTATGTNTTLQFGAENDPDGFGLDDVILTPIPAPSFRAVVKTNNLLQFSWNSLAGVAYQLQFSTNLLTTNWVNLGAPISATNSIATTTTNIGPDLERFYRIRRLP
jgi:subtilase family serine protease